VIVASYGEIALVRGLKFLAEKQASIANNLANVDTTSFKRRDAVATPSRPFHSLLDRELRAVDYTELSDLQRGTTRETGNTFDVAIDGPGWLRVQDDKGQRFYTRNGQLQLAADGRLTTRDGLTVLDQSGQPIQLGTGDQAPSSVTIAPNGTISNPDTGQTWGPIAVLDVPRPAALAPVGKSLFTDPENQRPQQSASGLQQGFLEGSNVDSLQELVQMISVERSFTATQKALSGIGRLQENLITNILR
jgi:flagellar basal-body rod protein FlgF